jgi:hypothetical protein
MPDDVIANIRARVAQCRRLAAMTTDKKTEAILLQMAAEGEIDVAGLEAWPDGAAQSAAPNKREP